MCGTVFKCASDVVTLNRKTEENCFISLHGPFVSVKAVCPHVSSPCDHPYLLAVLLVMQTRCLVPQLRLAPTGEVIPLLSSCRSSGLWLDQSQCSTPTDNHHMDQHLQKPGLTHGDRMVQNASQCLSLLDWPAVWMCTLELSHALLWKWAR